jgi:hypothetical protein
VGVIYKIKKGNGETVTFFGYYPIINTD